MIGCCGAQVDCEHGFVIIPVAAGRTVEVDELTVMTEMARREAARCGAELVSDTPVEVNEWQRRCQLGIPETCRLYRWEMHRPR